MAIRISRTARSMRGRSTSPALVAGIARVPGTAYAPLDLARVARAGHRAAGALTVTLGGQAGAVRRRGKREFLGGEHGGPVGGQPLAVAGVGAADRPLLHGGEDAGDFVSRQGFLVHELQHEVVEDVTVLYEDLPGLVMGRLDQPPHLFVDGRGDFLGVVAGV